MGTNRRDPDTGQFVGEEPTEAAPSSEEDYSWAIEFAKKANISPDDDPYDFRRRADQWSTLEDPLAGRSAYEQLKQTFEPPEPEAAPDPWDTFNEPTYEPDPYAGPPAAQPPVGITPEQLAQWWSGEQQRLQSEVSQNAYNEFLTRSTLIEAKDVVDKYDLPESYHRTISERAFEIQNRDTDGRYTPHKATEEAAQQILNEANELAARAAQIQSGEPPAQPASPPAGAGASTHQKATTLDEAADIMDDVWPQ